jgi:hypothetical protein
MLSASPLVVRPVLAQLLRPVLSDHRMQTVALPVVAGRNLILTRV